MSGTIIVFALPYFNLSVLFIFYAAVCLLGLFFIITFVIETKGKSKADIEHLFSEDGNSTYSHVDEDSA